jgi:hypothetical protein
MTVLGLNCPVPSWSWTAGRAALSARLFHFNNVTTNPTAEWFGRQITEAFPWNEAPRYLAIASMGDAAMRRIRAMGIRDKPIAPASPWQNSFAERLIENWKIRISAGRLGSTRPFGRAARPSVPMGVIAQQLGHADSAHRSPGRPGTARSFAFFALTACFSPGPPTTGRRWASRGH